MRTPFMPVLFACSLLGAPLRPEEPPKQRAGKYEVSLRLPPEGLCAQQEMQIEFRIVDLTQSDPLLGPLPVVRAQIESSIEMPAMPGMPKIQEAAHVEGVPGEYGVHPTFAHGGEYLLSLAIQPPEAEAFKVEFPLQVDDADAARHRKPKPPPYRLELVASPKTPKAGEPADLDLRVRVRDKPKEAFFSFELVHEKYMHLMIVRNDLAHFAHTHPEPNPDGVFRTRYVFPSGGEYHLFADVAPKGAGSQIMMVKLKVSGQSTSPFDITKVERVAAQKIGPIEIALETPANALPSKKTTTVAFSLKDSLGRPVTNLEPYLGAMGHLMIIHQDAVTFVHSHPDERQLNGGRDGSVSFLARLPKPGLYRAWAQFQREGKVLTGDFILQATE